MCINKEEIKLSVMKIGSAGLRNFLWKKDWLQKKNFPAVERFPKLRRNFKNEYFSLKRFIQPLRKEVLPKWKVMNLLNSTSAIESGQKTGIP